MVNANKVWVGEGQLMANSKDDCMEGIHQILTKSMPSFVEIRKWGQKAMIGHGKGMERFNVHGGGGQSKGTGRGSK